MSPPLTLVVLAAGQSRRYGGLKQLDPVGPGGATLVDYSVWDARRAGFARVVFVVRAELRAELERAWAPLAERIAVAWAEQRLDELPGGLAPPPGRSRPWGTGHAVLAAEAEVSGPFAVVNADDFYGADAFRAAAGFLRGGDPSGCEHAAVGFALRDTLSEGGAVNRALFHRGPGGWVESVREVLGIEHAGGDGRIPDGSGGWTRLDGGEPVSMNFWAFQPSLFGPLREELRRFATGLREPETGEFFLSDAVSALIRSGRARLRLLDAGVHWCGLTRPADRDRTARHLEALVDAGAYPERLWV